MLHANALSVLIVFFTMVLGTCLGMEFRPLNSSACALTDASFTDISSNCPFKMINVNESGPLTAVRVGLIIRHPANSELAIFLVPPGRTWIPNSPATGPYNATVASSNAAFTATSSPLLLFSVTRTNKLNLGNANTVEYFYVSSMADPVWGPDAGYWFDILNLDNLIGTSTLSSRGSDQKLARLQGAAINGNWSLIIGDTTSGNVGSLIDWIIDIKWCGDSEKTSPEECDSGVRCNSDCTCETGYQQDPSSNGCVEISCGDGVVGGEEECDGGYGCDSQCVCMAGWMKNQIPTPHCQLVGKKYTYTGFLDFLPDGFDTLATIEIPESGEIQFIKFGMLISHTWTSDIYLWIVPPNNKFTNSLPTAYSDQLIVDTDEDPDVIKLLGYYGDATGGTNIGISSSPLYMGTNNSPLFYAPRLDPGFKSCVGDVISPERTQEIKLDNLIGKNIQGSWKFIGGDFVADSDVGFIQQLSVTALFCGDEIWNPWVEQCDSSRGCLNTTCQCDSQLYRNESGSCILYTCGNGQIDSLEECELGSNHCVNCFCVDGATSDGNACYVGLAPGQIAGIVVACVGAPLIAGTVVLIVFAKQGKLKKKDKIALEKVPDNDNSIYKAISTNTTNSLHVVTTSNTEAERLPTTKNDRMAIPYASLVFKREIGSGSFGKVFIGEWQRTVVAIKVATLASPDEFTQEAQLSIDLRPHPNVVQVLGVSVDGQFPALVLEFCAGGSLDKRLYDQASPLSYADKLRLVVGISKGLFHLHNNNIVHRDLAARNILLSGTGDPKISDFGMSRLVNDNKGNTTKSNVGPIKWMAPESIKRKEYSKKSDIWSFGVVVWEVVTGQEPYKDEDLMELALNIRDTGKHLQIPDCEPIFQSIMTYCFNAEPHDRPEMDAICELLDKAMESLEG
jgi:predicted Ser/Thr protein kinase